MNIQIKQRPLTPEVLREPDSELKAAHIYSSLKDIEEGVLARTDEFAREMTEAVSADPESFAGLHDEHLMLRKVYDHPEWLDTETYLRNAGCPPSAVKWALMGEIPEWVGSYLMERIMLITALVGNARLTGPKEQRTPKEFFAGFISAQSTLSDEIVHSSLVSDLATTTTAQGHTVLQSSPDFRKAARLRLWGLASGAEDALRASLQADVRELSDWNEKGDQGFYAYVSISTPNSRWQYVVHVAMVLSNGTVQVAAPPHSFVAVIDTKELEAAAHRSSLLRSCLTPAAASRDARKHFMLDCNRAAGGDDSEWLRQTLESFAKLDKPFIEHMGLHPRDPAAEAENLSGERYTTHDWFGTVTSARNSTKAHPADYPIDSASLWEGQY